MSRIHTIVPCGVKWKYHLMSETLQYIVQLPYSGDNFLAQFSFIRHINVITLDI